MLALTALLVCRLCQPCRHLYWPRRSSALLVTIMLARSTSSEGDVDDEQEVRDDLGERRALVQDVA